VTPRPALRPRLAPARLAARAGLALVLFAILAGCRRPGPPVTREECDRLLDRYADMLLHGREPPFPPDEITRRRAAIREAASRDPAFATCTRDLTREEMDCALRAFNPDEIERCLIPMP
jgi:hypothetical protein